MKTPIMPQEFQAEMRFAWTEGDIELIVYLNRKWYEYVKQLREQETE